MHQAASANHRYSTENLDYLQRTGEKFALPDGIAEERAPAARAELQIRGVGRLAKESPDVGGQNATGDWQLNQLVSEACLIGLHEQGHPIAFRLAGDGAGTHLSVGLWGASRETPVPQDAAEVLEAMLDGAYPGIELSHRDGERDARRGRLTHSGVVRGVPTAKPPDAVDGAYAIDRLIRAMNGETWEALVLAEPLADAAIRQLRGYLLAEMRAVYSTADSSSPTPLTEHYEEMLTASLDAFSVSQAVGAWRVGVYLLGTEGSYPRLTGAWRGIFAGAASKPEPVRVTTLADASLLAASWTLPDDPEQPGPGGYSHPFRYQTVLSSSQLAGYVHLPQLETAGFAVRIAPQFDTVPPEVDAAQQFVIGERIVSRARDTWKPDINEDDGGDESEMGFRYAIKRGSLSKHVLVCGITGAGKTNTVFQLLREATRAGVPFLVLEPAKAEYRSLLDDELFKSTLQIFTVGAEWASPLRLNPFEILPGVPVGLHLDLLRSVFGASFGMWVPLPQVLERSLNEIYEDRGWDLAGRRPIDGEDRPAFPTLADLIEKVRDIVPGLGFDPEARDRILGSLVARLEGLRSGAKGRMYDVERSVDMASLLAEPTILELESLGDDDDKAFLMGLLFIRLAEHRRVRHEAGEPNRQHLLVIEEAHRLLTNVPRNADDKQADPRGKAVETFTNLLSEIRAYDEGVIIADQVPTRLAPDVIKNTNLKIAHRIVAGDDREELGLAMAMTPSQVIALGSLKDLHAAVFSGEVDDAPLLVRFEFLKPETQPNDVVVREVMSGREGWRFHPTPACEAYCEAIEDVSDGERSRAAIACSMGKRALQDTASRQALSRLALSAMDNPEAVAQLGRNLYGAVRRTMAEGSRPEQVYSCYVVHAGGWLADHWGARRRWSQPQIVKFASALRTMLRSLPPIGVGDLHASATEFQAVARELHSRASPPYDFCEEICKQRKGLCLYRYPSADALTSTGFRDEVRRVRAQGYEPLAQAAGRLQGLTRAMAWRLVPFPAVSDFPDGLDSDTTDGLREAFRRTQLCLAQQAIADDPRVLPAQARSLLQQVGERARAVDNGNAANGEE